MAATSPPGDVSRCDVRLPAASQKLTWLLTVVTGVSALLVALRALTGGPVVSFFFVIARPLNLESAAAVALLLVLAIRSRGVLERRSSPGNRWYVAGLALVLLVTLASYWKSLWFPFVSDDYVIVHRALRGEILGPVLTQGDAGVAFRPLTRFLFAAQGWLGSADPVWWHCVGLVLHLANCVLVFFLARWLVSTGAALFAAAVFGLHAAHPEAVSWMNSRSDVQAVFFLLCALLLFLSHWSRPRGSRLAAALVLMTLAVLSKESAYAFAPLAWLLVAAKERPNWRAVRALVPFLLVEAGLFAYRWVVLGGLGGYVNAESGRPMYLSIDLVRAAKVLLWRMWAILFFPVNWSVPTGVWLGLTLVLAAGGLVVLAGGRVERRTLLAVVGFVAFSILPVLPLALVGADLFGARLYYLASVGFALLLGVALHGVNSNPLRCGAAAAILLFHFAALQHQLGVWDSVTALARRTCIEAAQTGGVAKTPPNSINGVFFLGNGFPECVQFYAGDFPEWRGGPKP